MWVPDSLVYLDYNLGGPVGIRIDSGYTYAPLTLLKYILVCRYILKYSKSVAQMSHIGWIHEKMHRIERFLLT